MTFRVVTQNAAVNLTPVMPAGGTGAQVPANGLKKGLPGPK